METINKLNRPGAIVIEGHVQGLSNTRSLGELGIPVYVVDVTNCLARYSKYCRKFLCCPSFSSVEFVTFLIDLCEREGLFGWLLVPSNDHIVENLSIHFDEVSRYYKLFVPQKDKLYDIINKGRLINVAKSCGTSVPESCTGNELQLAAGFRFPLIVKGGFGLTFYKTMHAKALQVNTFEELCNVVHGLEGVIRCEDILIQELIPECDESKAISFTCFAQQGRIRTYWMGRKLREHPLKYGTATLAESICVPDILQEAEPLVSVLGYTGVCEIEFMLDSRDGNKYKLIEINPRTWLWVGLAKACGVDFVKCMYMTANRLDIIYPKSYEVGVKWINWLTDFTYSMKAIVTGKLSICHYFSQLRGLKVKAIWSWQDPLPGLLFPFMAPAIAHKRK